jgi:hypoxanthine phosphoribosyltransferase
MHDMQPTPAPNYRGTDEFLDVSWEMFGELCRALAFRVARDYHPDLVVGIARAGAIPAAIVASILRVDFYSMRISRKQGDKQILERPAVLSAAPVQARGKRVLLVDEIATSGDTLRLGLAAFRDIDATEVRTGTSFARTRGYKADYFALETDATIIFPWDRTVFEGEHLVVNPRYEGVVDE